MADVAGDADHCDRRVGTEPELRPAHGFLAPESWRRAFAAAGFDEVAVVPDVERIRDLYPRFFAGVVCGRRPPGDG